SFDPTESAQVPFHFSCHSFSFISDRKIGAECSLSEIGLVFYKLCRLATKGEIDTVFDTDWTTYVNKIQFSYLPAALACVGVFVVVGVFRDVVFTDFQPPLWVLILNAVGIATLIVTYSLLALKKMQPDYADLALLLCFLVICARPAVIFIFDETPATLVLPSVTFVTGMLFLSLRYLLTSQGFALAIWLVAVMEYLILPQYFITLVVSIVTGVLGLWLQNTRLAQVRHNYNLETRVENLETILPMCANCKHTRDSEGRWMSIEEYIESKEAAQISHALCPDCKDALYGDYLSMSSGQRAVVASQLRSTG
ncbi:MAG: hypothetical protein MI746_13310, partial [Pseudomonadales bacterium]|nr:hypothetical protein [Pseudomonadales bacterium]